jgi:hypothetical protein
MTPQEAIALLKEKEAATTREARDIDRLKQALKLVAGNWAKAPTPPQEPE